MIIVTGGAGLICSQLVKRLNQLGRTDILVVDNLQDTRKIKNLSTCVITDFLDKKQFRKLLKNAPQTLMNIEVIFHQGACSNTMVTDGRYVMDNNFQYSKEVFWFAQQRQIPLVYASSASVYGNSQTFSIDPSNESPINAYAYSKLLFDQFIRAHFCALTAPVVGLRYFNVYGPGETHKDAMASVMHHFAEQYEKFGYVRLFDGYDGYDAGMQCRDFVYVDDVVSVNLHCWQHPVSGIYNVGTGKTNTFNDVAACIINYFRFKEGKKPLNVNKLIKQDLIRYVSFPDKLKGKYQSYTCADIQSLQENLGYQNDFKTLDDAVAEYMTIRG